MVLLSELLEEMKNVHQKERKSISEEDETDSEHTDSGMRYSTPPSPT